MTQSQTIRPTQTGAPWSGYFKIDSRKLFLIPCQIETRISEDALKIMIFPDQFALDVHRRSLTPEEEEAGRKFPVLREGLSRADRLNNWKELAHRYTKPRAEWIARMVGQAEVDDNTDPFQQIEIRALPDFFVVTLHLPSGKRKAFRGRSIPRNLNYLEPSENSLFDGKSRWVREFAIAVEQGMGLQIPLVELEDEQVISRITVVGVRSDSESELHQILESHHYTSGVEFLPHGTVTNHTQHGMADLDADEDAESYFSRVFEAELPEPKKHASHFTEALGLPPESQSLTSRWGHARDGDYLQREQLRASIWEATGGFFVDRFLQGFTDGLDVAKLEAHFSDYVDPRGIMPTIRIGNLPYSILVTSRMPGRGWKENPEEDFSFYQRYAGILTNLIPEWIRMADAIKNPKITNPDSPYSLEEELERVLCMHPEGVSYGLRPLFLRNIWGFGASTYSILEHAEIITPEEADQLWEQVTDQRRRIEAFLTKIAYGLNIPGPGLRWPSRFLTSIPIPDVFDTPFPWVKDADENPNDYLHELVHGDPADDLSNALLYKLLYRSKQRGATMHLQNVPEGIDLEGLFKGTLDCFNTRLDAWIRALYLRRMTEINLHSDQSGISLGMYGVVENLKLTKEQPQNKGFIHAPSADHAVTASILKNGYNHFEDQYPEKNPYHLNISSDRVRTVLSILRALRSGLWLAEILGAQFERSLHDNQLNQFKDDFRARFPFRMGQDPSENSDPSNIRSLEVVDGLALAQALDSIIDELIREGSAAEKQKVLHAIRGIRDTLDALNDVLLHEAIFQAARGNYSRMDAVLDLMAGKGGPVELESFGTVQEKTEAAFGLSVMLSPDAGFTAISPLEQAEPVFAAWVSRILGPPSQIICLVDGEPTTLEDLSLQPIDLAYLMTQESGESVIKEMILQHAGKSANTEDVEIVLVVDFNQGANEDPEALPPKRSMRQAMDLGQMLIENFRHFRYLKPNDLLKQPLPEGDTGFDAVDLEELKERYNATRERLVDLRGELTNNARASQDVLREIGLFGITTSGAKVPWTGILTSAQKKLNNAGKVYQTLRAGDPDLGKQITTVIEAIQALMGKGFVVLPQFSVPQWPKIREQLSVHQNKILNDQPEERIHSWMQQTAETRPAVDVLEETILLTRPYVPDLFQPGIVTQVDDPEVYDAGWQALNNAELGDINHNSDRPDGSYGACVLHDISGQLVVEESPKIVGFQVDRWTDPLPHGRVDTAITFEADTPGQQPPNCCLVALHPDPDRGFWTVEDLEGIVSDTLDLAKIRSVDVHAYPDLQGLFPATYISPDGNIANHVEELLKEELALGDG